MKSELVVPLLIGDDAIGAFNIENDRIRMHFEIGIKKC